MIEPWRRSSALSVGLATPNARSGVVLKTVAQRAELPTSVLISL